MTMTMGLKLKKKMKLEREWLKKRNVVVLCVGTRKEEYDNTDTRVE